MNDVFSRAESYVNAKSATCVGIPSCVMYCSVAMIV